MIVIAFGVAAAEPCVLVAAVVVMAAALIGAAATGDVAAGAAIDVAGIFGLLGRHAAAGAAVAVVIVRR